MSMLRSVLIVGGAVAVGLGLIVLWAVMSQPPASERGPMTHVETPAELAAYVELGDVGLARAENFVGHQVWIVQGTVRNVSEQALRSVELRLEFKDYEGTTVDEFEGDALRSSLPVGESRSFEFRFEEPPEGWNFGLPAVQVVRVGY